MNILVKRKSKIHGKGIFTLKNIKKGKMFYSIPINKLSNLPRRRWAYIGKGKWIKDNKVLNWINHSCGANSKLNINIK